MDLLQFEGHDLYFDEPLDENVERLLKAAGEQYGTPEAELMLLQSYLMAPQHLTVLVALYRFYFYQHRHGDALVVADRALEVSANMLDFPSNWRYLSLPDVGAGAMKSMGLVRFYLLALKAAGYLYLRVGDRDKGIAMLSKVTELDESDRLGAGALLDVVSQASSADLADRRVAV